MRDIFGGGGPKGPSMFGSYMPNKNVLKEAELILMQLSTETHKLHLNQKAAP